MTEGTAEGDERMQQSFEHRWITALCLFALPLAGACVGETSLSSGSPEQTRNLGGAGREGESPSAASGETQIGNTGGTNAWDSSPIGSSGLGSTEPGPTGLSSSGLGFSELPDGRGGFNVEQAVYTETMGFDKARSERAFEATLYPLLRQQCSACHSSQTQAQAPMHADADLALAHAYALTRVNFAHPEDSKLVVRMGIDRHNCFASSCSAAAREMLAAVEAWKAQIEDTLVPTPRALDAAQKLVEADVVQWIQTDRAQLSTADAPFIKYASLHELHNAGASAAELNVARAALSKALNSTARWAPEIVNPVDINQQGLVFRFDIRDYWGYNKGVRQLHFGGSDDDLVFGTSKVNYLGEPVSQAAMNQRYDFAKSVSVDPEFAQLIWRRVLAGNVEGAISSGPLPPNTDGFRDEYIEASQLVYTLTRPDVYNAIMLIPWYATELEDELGIDRSQGMSSYQYMLTKQAITVDARLYYRARQASGGYYWKTWDVFTGQLDGIGDIDQAYAQGEIRFPFWANPIPKFIRGTDFSTSAESLSFIATLAQPLNTVPDGCDPQPNYSGIAGFYNCRHYTGTSGLQQSASEIIWDLPNGLQGYMLTGAFNQRRVDAFVNIVRDYRLLRSASDQAINSRIGYATPDRRLNNGSSCMGCHVDGLNRGNNDLRDWLDNSGPLPKGPYGVDSWINDEATKAKVRELYPASSEMRPIMEADRRVFMTAMAKIRQGMLLGADKNLYVEPVIWAVEWAQEHYDYPQTRSN